MPQLVHSARPKGRARCPRCHGFVVMEPVAGAGAPDPACMNCGWRPGRRAAAADDERGRRHRPRMPAAGA